MAGIYLHIPFCKQACHYCDFHFSTNQEFKEEMSQAIVRELVLRKDYLSAPIETIYFGGGTPSLLSTRSLVSMLDTIREHYLLTPNTEITLEANPDDLTPEKLAELYRAGINRLSIGIQSFIDTELEFLNRVHSSSDAAQCVTFARAAGFKNISIDLIYGIPIQTTESWAANIEQALRLKPEHISAYTLTIEEKTVFGRWQAKGKLKPVDDDTTVAQLDMLIDALQRENFEQYEVSNFAQPGYISKHNSNYWQREKYIGVGPSAHSFSLDSRQFNVSNNHAYLREIARQQIPATVEILSRQDNVNDYLLTRLRTKWGIDLNLLKFDFQYDLQKEHGRYIEALVSQHHATLSAQNVLLLTRTGKLLSDKIATDFFLVDTPDDFNT